MEADARNVLIVRPRKSKVGVIGWGRVGGTN